MSYLCRVRVLAADGQEDLADGHTGAGALGLAESAAHARLQPIRPGTGKHFVDPQHVEGMHAHAQVEGILSSVLDHVLVGCNAGSLQCLTGDLLLLPAAYQGPIRTISCLDSALKL